MTIKSAILSALAQPMTSLELATRLNLDPHLVRVTISELKLAPVGTKRESKMGPQSFVWARAASAASAPPFSLRSSIR